MPDRRPAPPAWCACVLFAVAVLLPAAARPARGQLREVPAREVDALLERLEDADADTRRIARIQVQNLPGPAYEAVEKASRDTALDPGSLSALRSAVPLLRARARQTKFHRENHQDNLRTALDAYDKVGRKSPKWDAAAREAITLLVKPEALRAPGETDQTVADAFQKAVDAGCDDPFILYLQARSQIVLPGADRRAVLARHRAALFKLAESNYPADRKLVAAGRYAQEIDTPEPKVMDVCMRFLEETVSPRTPRKREYVGELVDLVYSGLSKVRGNQEAFGAIDAVYGRYSPENDPGPHVFKGKRYTDYAWEARGKGYANTVTPEGWKLFRERLAVARAALTKAWELDPGDGRAPAAMLTVCLGEGSGREEMETWFRRAMEADPDNRKACFAKLYYLYPRWHGSHEEMVAFGRECLATQNWWGPVPTILVDAHRQIGEESGDEKAYMARPEVWADLKAVYGSFLDAFPDSPRAPWYRNRLAKWACDCRRWQDADKLLRAIGDDPDLYVFRSKAVFNYYRKKAARKATEPPEPPPLPAADPNADEADAEGSQ